MNIHNNARLTPIGRERIVMQVASGQTPQAAGRAAGVCPRTVRKWVARYAVEGVAGLQDRSSRPKRLYRPTPQTVIARIGALRLQRLTGKAIARETGVSPATGRHRRRMLRRMECPRCRTGPRHLHHDTRLGIGHNLTNAVGIIGSKFQRR